MHTRSSFWQRLYASVFSFPLESVVQKQIMHFYLGYGDKKCRKLMKTYSSIGPEKAAEDDDSSTNCDYMVKLSFNLIAFHTTDQDAMVRVVGHKPLTG